MKVRRKLNDMLNPSEFEGYFLIPPAPQEQLQEHQKDLYRKLANQSQNKLFLLLPFIKEVREKEPSLRCYYKFIPLVVKTKEEWQRLFEKVTTLGLQNDYPNLVEQGKSLTSYSIFRDG